MNLLSVAYNILKSEGGKLSLDVLTKLIISSKQLEIANPLDITPEKVGEIINTHGLNIWIEGNDALIKKKEISSIYLLFTQLSDTIRIETSNPELVALGLIFYKRITEERQIYSELGHLKLKDLSTINKNNNARASLIAEFQKISQSEILENSFDEILLQVRRLENYTIQLFLTRLSQEDFSVQSYSSNQFAQQFEKLSLTVDKLYGSNNELPLFTKELILALADRNDFKNVYIPCFQTSSLIASLNQLNKQEKGVLAEGINTLSLGHKRMSLFLYGLDSTTLQKNNALQNSISRPDSFDLIICHPPFGLKLSEDIGDTTNNYLQFGSSREAYLLYIQLLLSRLNPQGLGIIVIPNGFLNSTEQVAIAIRKYIVENDLLEMVISIPSGIYQSNFVSTSILVLNRKKISGKKGKLTFVNTASIYATALDESLIPSMAYNTIKDIDSLKNIEMVQQTVSNLDVKINEYNLHLPFYINSYLDKIESLKKEGVNVESLGNVVLNVNFSTYNGNKEFKIVTTKELSRNNKEPFLKTENLAFTNKAGGKILNQTSIILAKNGGKLNPTIFKYNNEPIVANHNLIVLVPNEELINPEYFVQILEHQIVKEQLNARLKGVAQQYYSLDDLKEILIPLPSLKEQLANIILSEKSLVTKLEKDLVDIADQKKETEYAILSALRHSFGQKPFDNYLNNIETYLKDSIQNNRIINWNDKLSGHQSALTLRKTFDSLFGLVKDTNDLFTNMKELFSVDNNAVHIEKFEIIQLIKEAVNETEGTENIEFIYPELACEAFVDKLLLKLLITNLITNTVKHGFNGYNIKEKTIIFDVRSNIEEGKWIMNYYNNGKNLPAGYKHEDFIAFGNKGANSSGSGIGGHLIKRVVEKHHGTFSISNIDMDGLSYLTVPVLSVDENGQTIEVNSLISGGVKFKFVFNNLISYE